MEGDAGFIGQLLLLAGAIAIIILLTGKLRVHPFFALFATSLVIGVTAGLPFTEVFTTMKNGFGHIMTSLGFIIVLGSALGIILERTGATTDLAAFILRVAGVKNSPLAMSVTGFVVGLPIFCDSGYIVLSGLNRSLAARTRLPVILPAVALATGLYSVHCLIPPHPGASAAAALIGVSFGKVIVTGALIAIPAMVVAYIWTRFAARRVSASDDPVVIDTDHPATGPGVIRSALPVFLPIALIAARSFADGVEETIIGQALRILGEPAIALMVGIVAALMNFGGRNRSQIREVLSDAAEKSGAILVIIGAGGAFGAVLAAVKPGEAFSYFFPLEQAGLLFPFLLTALIKTAQGSSTVAIITAASIVQPMLTRLHLEGEDGRLLTVLAMGAGSMMISHANDAYFWVISKFENLPMAPMLRVYSVATVLMGVTSYLVVWILSLLWL